MARFIDIRARRWCVVLAVVLLGCGQGADDKRASVGGAVTLDGEPLASGWMTFTPIAGTKGPTSGCTFENGAYHVPQQTGPVIGKYAVAIYANRPTGRMVKSPSGDMVEELLELVPPKYNSKTILEIEVVAGKNNKDFDLKSK